MKTNRIVILSSGMFVRGLRCVTVGGDALMVHGVTRNEVLADTFTDSEAAELLARLGIDYAAA